MRQRCQNKDQVPVWREWSTRWLVTLTAVGLLIANVGSLFWTVSCHSNRNAHFVLGPGYVATQWLTSHPWGAALDYRALYKLRDITQFQPVAVHRQPSFSAALRRFAYHSWFRWGDAGAFCGLCVPLWVPLVPSAAATIVLWRRRPRRRRSVGERCWCGYDLRHNVSGRCPECGTELETVGRARVSDSGRR